MIIHELSAAECRDILSRTHVARLACSRHDQPYIVPIHFSFDHERHCVYSFSAVGQKVQWMRDNPKVCLELDDIADKDHWTTVVVMGRYEEIQQAADHADARRRAERLFERRREWWLPGAAGVAGASEHPDVVIYRIAIDRVSGRRASRGQ